MSSAETSQAEPGKLEQWQRRYPWLDHLVRAGTRYTDKHGDHYAAAITYFSILALVPLLMIAFAAAGYVLLGDPSLLDQLKSTITDAAPPGLGETLSPIIDQAITSRNTVGIVGLLGALYTGLSWMGQLREALTAQWDRPGEAPGFVARYAGDFAAMVGLGLAMVLSFGITAAATGLSSTLLDLVGLGGSGIAKVVLAVLGIVITLAANWLVFLWVLARLPREPVTTRGAARAALLASVGFVILQQVATVYLASVTKSPAGAAFGPIIGLLVFANLVSRFILFVTAWAATLGENEQDRLPEPAPALVRPQVVVGSRPGPRVTAALLGVGAVAGMVLRGLPGRRDPHIHLGEPTERD